MIRKIIRQILKEQYDNLINENSGYQNKVYFHGIQGLRLEKFLKTGKIPKAQQAFGGYFSITDDYDLAKQYAGSDGIIIEIKLKPNTDIEIGDPFEDDFIAEGDLTDVGEGEFLVNNPDCLIYKKDINEGIGDFNYNKTFQVPYDVAKSCKEAMSKYNSKLQTAVELSAEGKHQTFNEVKKLRDFFRENINNKQDPKILKSWELHGGDACHRWVEKVLPKFHDENSRTKKNIQKLGGAGEKKGKGVFDTKLMDTRKGRNNIR